MLPILIDSIKSQYQLISGLPTWAWIVYCIICFVPVIMCLIMDHNSILKPSGRSNNTINTVFWLAVMLVVPFFGSLLYLAGSFIPYRIWRRRHSSAHSFAYQHPLRSWQLQWLPISIAAGYAIGKAYRYICDTINLEFKFSDLIDQNDFLFEASFLCWLLLILADRSRTVSRREMYFRISVLEDETHELTPLFGTDYRASADILQCSRETREYVRSIARRYADETYGSNVMIERLRDQSQTFFYDGMSYSVTVLGTSAQWLQMHPDVIDSRYIGQGISRLCIVDWNSTVEGSVSGTELVVYKSVPRYTELFRRAAILLLVQTALCSGWAAAANTAAVQLLDKLLSSFK